MLESQRRVVVVVLPSLLLTAVLISGEPILDRGWWNRTVFYQVYSRSFMDTDGDGVGDLKGITSKLEYFVESGIGAIWLSSVNRSPTVDYDISDFKDIDERFGTLEDFENLTARAKVLGLKIILDLVPNHTSDRHYWFTESIKRIGKYADYYVWMDGKDNNREPPNNWLSVFGGSAWTYHKSRRQWYLHQFHRRQPDLNYANPHVQEEMREIVVFWLGKGADGFHLDAVPHLCETNLTSDEPRSDTNDVVTKDEYDYLNHTLTRDQPETYELVSSWRMILDEYASRHNTSEKIIMTEAYTTLENAVKYYDYGSDIPLNFNFITDVTAATSNATAFKSIIQKWTQAMPEGRVANWVMGNHDRSRVASRFPGRADQMTMLAMILPGVAVTYYGEEIEMVDKTDISWEDTQDPRGCNAGKEKYNSRSRDPIRTPFQWNIGINAGFSIANKTWLPVNDNYMTVNLMAQRYTNESHYCIYRALTALRDTSDALKFGTLTVEVVNSNVLCVLRKTSVEAVTLLINFSDKDKQEIDLRGALTGFKDGTIRAASVGFGIKQNQTVELEKVNIPAKASIVFLAVSKAPPAYAASLRMILLSTILLIITL